MAVMEEQTTLCLLSLQVWWVVCGAGNGMTAGGKMQVSLGEWTPISACLNISAGGGTQAGFVRVAWVAKFTSGAGGLPDFTFLHLVLLVYVCQEMEEVIRHLSEVVNAVSWDQLWLDD